MFHHSTAPSHTIYRAAAHLNTTSQHNNTTSTFRSFDNDGVVGGLIAGGVILAIVIILVAVIFRDN